MVKLFSDVKFRADLVFPDIGEDRLLYGIVESKACSE